MRGQVARVAPELSSRALVELVEREAALDVGTGADLAARSTALGLSSAGPTMGRSPRESTEPARRASKGRGIDRGHDGVQEKV